MCRSCFQETAPRLLHEDSVQKTKLKTFNVCWHQLGVAPLSLEQLVHVCQPLVHLLDSVGCCTQTAFVIWAQLTAAGHRLHHHQGIVQGLECSHSVFLHGLSELLVDLLALLPGWDRTHRTHRRLETKLQTSSSRSLSGSSPKVSASA